MQDFATRDEIYLLIATGALSVDIRSASLREPGRVLVFAPGDEHLQKITGRTDASLNAPLTIRQAMDPEISKMLSNADEQDLRIANLRCRIVRGRLQNGPCASDPSVPARTLRRWNASYRAAETKYRERISGTAAAVARSRKLDPTPARKHSALDERVHCRRLRNSEAEVHVHFLDWIETSVRSAEYPGSELQNIHPCGSRERQVFGRR